MYITVINEPHGAFNWLPIMSIPNITLPFQFEYYKNQLTETVQNSRRNAAACTIIWIGKKTQMTGLIVCIPWSGAIRWWRSIGFRHDLDQHAVKFQHRLKCSKSNFTPFLSLLFLEPPLETKQVTVKGSSSKHQSCTKQLVFLQQWQELHIYISRIDPYNCTRS